MQDIAAIWLSLAAGLAVIGVAGVRFSRHGDIIAGKGSMSRGWVGMILLASVTIAPEVVVAISALPIGAVDLACLPGPLFADVSISHAASAFSAMMMSGLAVVGLVLRPASRVLRSVSWVSLMLLVIYLLNTLFLHLYGH